MYGLVSYVWSQLGGLLLDVSCMWLLNVLCKDCMVMPT